MDIISHSSLISMGKTQKVLLPSRTARVHQEEPKDGSQWNSSPPSLSLSLWAILSSGDFRERREFEYQYAW